MTVKMINRKHGKIKPSNYLRKKKILLIMLTVDHHFSCLCFDGCKPHVFNRKGHDWEEGGGVGG